MNKRSPITRTRAANKTAPKKSVAIVPVRAEEPNVNTLPTLQELPLAFLSSASKVSLQQFALNRMARAEGNQRAIAELIRDVI